MPSNEPGQQTTSGNGSDKAAVTVTVAEALSGNSRYAHGPNITVEDTAANIAALTAAQITSLDKVDLFRATDGALGLRVDQALAVGTGRMASSQVIVADTGAAIEALTVRELRNLEAVWKFEAVDGPLTLHVNQLIAIIPSQVMDDEQVIVSDTGANLTTLVSRGTWGPAQGIDLIHATDGAAVTMNVNQFHTYLPVFDEALEVGLLDTGWNLSYSGDLDNPRVLSIHAMDGMPIRLRDPDLLAKLGADDVVQLVLPSPVEGVNITTEQLLDHRIREVAPDTGDITISVASLNVLTSNGVALQHDVHVQATPGQDIVPDAAITTASLWVFYNGGGLAGTAVAHLAGGALADGDSFALQGVDSIVHDPAGIWVRDLVSFGQDLGLQPGATPFLEHGMVGDAGYALVPGKLDGDAFMVDSNGSDTLILWDDDPAAGAVRQGAVVVAGAGALQHWYDGAGALVVGVPEHVWG